MRVRRCWAPKILDPNRHHPTAGRERVGELNRQPTARQSCSHMTPGCRGSKLSHGRYDGRVSSRTDANATDVVKPPASASSVRRNARPTRGLSNPLVPSDGLVPSARGDRYIHTYVRTGYQPDLAKLLDEVAILWILLVALQVNREQRVAPAGIFVEEVRRYFAVPVALVHHRHDVEEPSYLHLEKPLDEEATLHVVAHLRKSISSKFALSFFVLR